MRYRPKISTPQAVSIYRKSLWFRRKLHDDYTFARMTDVWDTLCHDLEDWRIKLYRSNPDQEYEKKAGVIKFEDRVLLTADERLFEDARNGCKLANFILAHELGHLVLEHHERNAVVKNYKLYAGPTGLANIPPTPEELDANFAGVFLQCGAALENPKWGKKQLADKAFSDVHYVALAQKFVQLDVFKKELIRQEARYERVVL